MRFRHPDGTIVHLAYCTNVHAAADLPGLLAGLARYAEPVRQRLGVNRLGVGLWLAAPVATSLAADPGALARLRTELAARGLTVVTLNAFPYQGFQAAEVKYAVYRPDWTHRSRLEYTLACAQVLIALLPDDETDGSISTLPLAWRTPWTDADAATVAKHLDELAAALAALADRTGRLIRVGFEPEPGCLLDRTAQAVDLMSDVDTERLGVCVDACHLAVGFEDPGAAVATLAGAGLSVVKAQASCALALDDPADPTARAALARFVESRFLHQTRDAGGNGVDDLPAALAGGLSRQNPWRVHYHVPLHADPPAPLRATADCLRSCLGALLGGPTALTRHVEVETYTWPVLPGRAANLVAGIADELRWARRELVAIGLTEQPC